MAKKRKISKVRSEYNKERRRIQNFLRRAEKRGYIDTEDILPPVPKTVTQASVRRLKKLTANELYKKMKFVDRETGAIYSGTRGREIEREQAGKKAARTRKENKEAERQFWDGVQPGPTPAGSDVHTGALPPSGGEIIYDNIVEEIIRRLTEPISAEAVSFYYGRKFKRGSNLMETVRKRAQELVDFIENLTKKDGKSAIGWRLQDHAMELQQYIDMLLYASSSDQVELAFQAIMRIMKGAELTTSEKELVNAVAETYESWDPEE